MPESSLITRVLADIRELEKTLTAAERRWKLYQERASAAAAVSVSGGAFGGFAPRGGGGGTASASAQQRSDLKKQEEELKASLKRQQSELEATLRARTEARKSAQTRDEAILKAGLDKERELLRQRGQSALQEQRNQDRLASEARVEARRKEAQAERATQAQRTRADREARAAAIKADREAAAEAKRLAREEFAIRETQRRFREQREREAARATIAERKEAMREAARAQREADREARRQARVVAQARREEASSLRGQIVRIVGPGAGAGPPFGPLPSGSSPEAIARLRQHLEQANSAGARLSRTLRRIGTEDLRKMEQSARFFRNALVAAGSAAVLGGFFQLVKRGIELNREWERFRFGLGTALALTSKVVDAQGKTVTGARAFRVFARDAEGLFKQIREEANKTILTTEELVQVVTENFANAIRAGIPEDKILGLASRVAQVGKSLGLPGGPQQLSQEIRAILEGENLRNATVAKTLGLTSERIKQAKEEGQLLELINSELTKADVIVTNFEQSSEAAFTTLLSKGQDFLRLTLEDVFKRLTGRVLDFNKELSSENIERFARRAGRTLTDFFRPIERFIESGQAAKLGEAFTQGFRALERLALSGTFDVALKFFNFLVANADKILPILLGLGTLRGANALNQFVASLGRPGGLLAGTAVGGRLAERGLLSAFGGSAAEVGGGAAAGAGLRGLFTRAGAGAALRGLGGAAVRATPLGLIAGAATDVGLFSLRQRQRAELAQEEQRAALQREPGARDVRAQLGIARQALQDVQAQIREAVGRGERVTAETRFPVALGGDQERIIQISFEQAQRRVRIAEEAQRKLRQVEKEGGDRRVEDVGENFKQILDLEKIGFEQRIAQFEGNVRKQIELETVLAVAGAQVGKDTIRNEEQRQRFIAAAREEGGRKLRELDRQAFFETTKAEAEAANNRRRQRQVETGQEIAEIRERVRTQQITTEQGERQIAARLKQFRREDLEDFRKTRDQAVEVQNDFTRLTIRAQREQQEARKRLRDFERQTAREARDNIRQQIDAEQDLTEAIRNQTKLREDLALRRRGLGFRREERAAREATEQAVGGVLGGDIRRALRQQAGLTTPAEEDLAAQVQELVREIAEAVGGSLARNPKALETDIRQLLEERGIAGISDRQAERLARATFPLVAGARRRRLSRQDIEREQESLEIGREAEQIETRRRGLTIGEQQELANELLRQAVGGAVNVPRLRELQRIEREAGTVREEADAERAVRQQREQLADLVVQENEARRQAVETFADLRRQIADTTIDLSNDFLNLGKQARDLIPDLGQFGAALKPLANIINEIARLTPAAAGARAQAIGPSNINLTVDLQGALGAGAVLDPLVQRILGAVFAQLEQQFRRGPVRGG